jgi:hypothetical protein
MWCSVKSDLSSNVDEIFSKCSIFVVIYTCIVPESGSKERFHASAMRAIKFSKNYPYIGHQKIEKNFPYPEPCHFDHLILSSTKNCISSVSHIHFKCNIYIIPTSHLFPSIGCFPRYFICFIKLRSSVYLPFL